MRIDISKDTKLDYNPFYKIFKIIENEYDDDKENVVYITHEEAKLLIDEMQKILNEVENDTN